MIPVDFKPMTITVGHIPIKRVGKPTEKTPEGATGEFIATWRAVPDAGNGLPGVVAQGESKGTIYQLHLTGGNLDKMMREVERVIDEERGKSNARWGVAG